MHRLMHDMNERRVLDCQSVQLRILANRGHGASSEVLLFVFAGDRVLVAEDKVNLRGAFSM